MVQSGYAFHSNSGDVSEGVTAGAGARQEPRGSTRKEKTLELSKLEGSNKHLLGAMSRNKSPDREISSTPHPGWKERAHALDTVQFLFNNKKLISMYFSYNRHV